MIAFTDAQLTTIQIIAAPLPLQLRSEFLQALAAELCGAVSLPTIRHCMMLPSEPASG